VKLTEASSVIDCIATARRTSYVRRDKDDDNYRGGDGSGGRESV
jgi:hypothetical protein